MVDYKSFSEKCGLCKTGTVAYELSVEDPTHLKSSTVTCGACQTDYEVALMRKIDGTVTVIATDVHLRR